MSETMIDSLIDELAEKMTRLGKLGLTANFVVDGMGAVNIDATGEQAVVTKGGGLPADITITAPLQVWLDMRAKKLAPHVAAMTRKIRIDGDLMKGMKLAPQLVALL